ncbi:unnamed protein product [Euphydryas editha]|uniref:Uncharacterized protein n=1 Tax=Euphydryas editha TaxID=104508 RepID=A0AAU9UTT3_EUPED|nr:unnamed protein product [Euphydryas editha]
MRRAILLLLAALLAAAAACPWACSCRPNAADCAHRALLHAPRRLPTDAHRLKEAATPARGSFHSDAVAFIGY